MQQLGGGSEQPKRLTDQNRATTCLLVLCGLPGAGKSTIARQLSNHIHVSSDCSAVVDVDHICFDDFQTNSEADASAFAPHQWKASRLAAFAALKRSLQQRQPPGQYRLVIADDTMHYRSMRQECYNLARSECAAYIQVYITTALQHALSNNKQRLSIDQVPEAVITATFAKFQNPGASSQHPWDLHSTIAFDTSRNIEELSAAICIKWGQAAAPLFDHQSAAAEKQAAQEATRSNTIHRADVTTRHILSTTLVRINTPANDKGSVANELAMHRRRMVVGDALQGKTDEEIGQAVAAFETLCEEYLV